MGTVGMALVVGGMALLFSGLIFLIPVRGARPVSQESFEHSQEWLEQHLEMRRNRGEIDNWEEVSVNPRQWRVVLAGVKPSIVRESSTAPRR